MMRWARYILAAALMGGAAHAETLGEATRAAVDTSPVLHGEEQRLEAIRETLPQAWAQMLPQISIDASAVESRTTEPTSPFRVREQERYWIASVRTSTLLFAGGRLLAERRLAHAQIAEGVARYQSTMQDFIVEVTRAYGGVREAQAALAAQQQAVENFTEQRRYVSAHVRTGFLTRTDLAQADARLANARAALALANAQLVAANEAYERLVGHPPMGLEAPRPLTGLPTDLASAQATAQRENPRVVAQLAAYEVSDANVRIAQAQGRANVRLETSDSAFNTIEDAPGLGEESEDSVALRVAVPLFSGGGIRAREEQQRHLRRAERYDLEEVRRRVREEVSVAWHNLAAARTRLEATRTRVEAAELANAGMQRERDVGTRSIIDVLDQETELLNARIALAQAEREAMVAERELAARVGDVHTLATQAEGGFQAVE
jgi:outer membrane protein